MGKMQKEVQREKSRKKHKRTLHVRILRSMLIMIILMLFCTCGIYSFIAYNQTMRITKESIQQEADYLAESVEDGGIEYLRKMDLSNPETRVTFVDKKGTVLYDSKQKGEPLGNHGDRPEIKQALKHGVGEYVRKSDTVGQEMYYYACRLQDGNILRISKIVETAFYITKTMVPVMGLIGVVMFLLSAIFAKIQSDRLVRPINCLDLDNPLENDVYEELTPLLESINRQNKEKDAIANMRKEFTANVSHELKTPLTSISGYAEIMKSGLVKNEDMQGFSERIYQEASRLILLIEDIIKLSRLDEGNVEIEKEEIDLYELCREICTRLAPLYRKKEVKVELVGEGVHYTGIRPIIDEMIYNICENAIKYTRAGGLVKIWVGKTLQGIRIIVSDTGIGIPKEDLERIFERFYRVDKSHSKETGGTGLGLSIVKHGAMLHKIEISVESEEGRGTRMELKF